jgi:hypothetical protein
MATDPKEPFPGKAVSTGHDGLGKWVLGALGLVWIFRLATRASRRDGLGLLHRQRLSHENSGAPTTTGSRPHPVHGYEQRDANAKWIFGIVLFLLISVLAIHGILAGFLSSLKNTAPPTDGWQASTSSNLNLPPPPRLQVSASAELQAFRANEEAKLHSYGWIDRTAGVVRIPIEQAMDAVVSNGLPARTSTNQNQKGPSAYELIRQRTVQPAPQGEK